MEVRMGRRREQAFLFVAHLIDSLDLLLAPCDWFASAGAEGFAQITK
jgi:hypothetical protein